MVAVTRRWSAGAGAGDVEEMTLAVVNLFGVGFFCDGFDAGLKGDDGIVAGDDGDGAEFEAFWRGAWCR